MSFVKLLVPLIGDNSDAVALATAIAAARPFGAHVQGLFVCGDPAAALPLMGEGVPTAMMAEIVSATEKAITEMSGRAKTSLEAAAQAAGLAVTAAPEKHDAVTLSWRSAEGYFADEVLRASLTADMVVFGPLASAIHPSLSEAFEETLMKSGRPVLLSPEAGVAVFPKRIALGWDGSVPAARAVSAALPYLTHAEHVDVLAISHDKAPDGLDDLCTYLKMHGVATTAKAIDAANRPIGAVLLEAASAGGAGALVLGAYGHSRVTQFLFGGVTRHVISHANIPLLLAH